MSGYDKPTSGKSRSTVFTPPIIGFIALGVLLPLVPGWTLLWMAQNPQPTKVSQRPTATATTSESRPGIGDPVSDGRSAFVVTGIEEPGRSYDRGGSLEDEADGEWFIVHMTVENVSREPWYFSAAEQKLLWDGVEFSGEDSTLNGTGVEDLNPGMVLEVTIMFDVPTRFPDGGAGAVLELHDGYSFVDGANVYL